MYISYFDESGDDGYPQCSSPIFVLSSLYMHEEVWKSNYKLLQDFRNQLKICHSLPTKQEFHTRHFIADKGLYHGKYTPGVRKEIIFSYFELIAKLELKIINVVIDKTRIKTSNYTVLENALTYNVQRIENDLSPLKKKFMIITDEGRLGKMRKQVRKIQRINYIPSKFRPESYRKEIVNLVEEPLSKESSESYFIQSVDIIATIVYLYALQNLCGTKLPWANRIKNVLSYGDEINLLSLIENKLNLAASKNRFGIVCYPK